MTEFLYGRSANLGLAILVVALGVIALAGTPQSDETVSIDLQELAVIVENEVDHVSVQQLADELIRGETNYRLIDLRSPTEYAAYHIPAAENVQLTGLLDYPLLRNERIVLYSGGGIHSAQAWFLLRAKGYKAVYMLLGGLASWKEEILFPTISADASAEELAAFGEADAVARHFGGSGRRLRAGQSGDVDVVLPEGQMPPPPVIAPTAPVINSGRKRAREGC